MPASSTSFRRWLRLWQTDIVIHYTLHCDNGHEFESWFASGEDFDRQAKAGFVACPACNSLNVGKSLMAPSVSTARKKEEAQAVAMDNTRREMMQRLKEVVGEIRRNADDVGEKFPEEARKIHYGEVEARGIIGQATPNEAEALIDEGIEIAALPVFPEETN